MASHGCNNEVALIATEGHGAIDVFYITRQGSTLPEVEKQLRDDLTLALSQEPGK
jgi:hypothetical protein